MFFAEGTEL